MWQHSRRLATLRSPHDQWLTSTAQKAIVTIGRIDQYIDISTAIERDQADYNQLVQYDFWTR